MWQICQHSKGTVNKGLHVDPSGLHVSFDCFVNADCAGNWNLPEAEDPNMVKSQCGCIVTPGNIPVLWKSKWIQEICLSAMESKCISLSMAAHSLICLHGLLLKTDGICGLGLGDKTSTISANV